MFESVGGGGGGWRPPESSDVAVVFTELIDANLHNTEA